MTSQLLINEPPLQVLPTLASIIGLNEAIVLQQIHYWLHPQSNKNYFEGRHWVYNTYEQWQKQFPFYSERTLRRIVRNLEDSKLLLSCKGGELNQTKYYTIDYVVLQDACLNFQKGLLKETEQGSLPLEGHPEVKASPKYPLNGHPEEDMGIQKQAIGNQNQNDISYASFLWEHTEVDQHPLKSTQKNVIYPNWPKWPDHVANLATPSGQSGQTIRPKWPPQLANLTTPSGQFGHLSYTETTTEITTENNTLPLLPPPSQVTARAKKEEEEEQKNNFLLSNPQLPSLLPCEQMLQTWNTAVQSKLHPGKDVHLTVRRKHLLDELLQNVLNGKLESWQDYCALIAGSKFLMGNNPSGFKVTLDWACVPDNAHKVLEGAIYDKPEVSNSMPNELPWEEFETELAKTLPSGPYLLPWLKISLQLAKLMGQHKYRCCFATVLLKELTQTTAIFTVDSAVIRDSLIRNYSSYIRCAVVNVCPTIKDFKFEVCPPKGNTNNPLTTRG